MQALGSLPSTLFATCLTFCLPLIQTVNTHISVGSQLLPVQDLARASGPHGMHRGVLNAATAALSSSGMQRDWLRLLRVARAAAGQGQGAP
jgi:hypothetical protein